MNDQEAAHGVIITQREVFDRVEKMDAKVDKVLGAVEQMVAVNRRLDGHGDRLRKAESQIAAQWIVVGIVVTVLGAAAVRVIMG